MYAGICIYAYNSHLVMAAATAGFAVFFAQRAATKLESTVLPEDVGAQMSTDRLSSIYFRAL